MTSDFLLCKFVYFVCHVIFKRNEIGNLPLADIVELIINGFSCTKVTEQKEGNNLNPLHFLAKVILRNAFDAFDEIDKKKDAAKHDNVLPSFSHNYLLFISLFPFPTLINFCRCRKDLGKIFKGRTVSKACVGQSVSLIQ